VQDTSPMWRECYADIIFVLSARVAVVLEVPRLTHCKWTIVGILPGWGTDRKSQGAGGKRDRSQEEAATGGDVRSQMPCARQGQSCPDLKFQFIFVSLITLKSLRDVDEPPIPGNLMEGCMRRQHPEPGSASNLKSHSVLRSSKSIVHSERGSHGHYMQEMRKSGFCFRWGRTETVMDELQHPAMRQLQ